LSVYFARIDIATSQKGKNKQKPCERKRVAHEGTSPNASLVVDVGLELADFVQ